ncbi:MAG: hypothetical protein DCC51_04435 [Anaerolineae bacterium]|nr:MAG: hypothetical protein DCC51_04435 [Anaerolineae bacterium]
MEFSTLIYQSTCEVSSIHMEGQLKDGLLSFIETVYQIGYFILGPDLIVRVGDRSISRWLELPGEYYIGQPVTEAFPELIGSEAKLLTLSADGGVYRLENIFKPLHNNRGGYVDLNVIRLAGDQKELLLAAVDVTEKTHYEQLLQQQRNEVHLLSAELTLANERLGYIINRLLPAPVANELLHDRSLPEPGGNVVREATILFADMRDFTSHAEVYQPVDTLEFLNMYMKVVSEAILKFDGSLTQLVGDMVMGVFNLPEAQSDHANRAVRAAIEIQSSLRSFNETSGSRFPAAAFGIGISTGSVISGYLGFQQRFRYAVVGDATNVAFHLSSLAAGGRILLSETTMAGIDKDLVNLAIEKGDLQLKRRRKAVKVFELSPLAGITH